MGARVGALCGWRDDTSDRSGVGDRPVVRAEMLVKRKRETGLGCAGSDRAGAKPQHRCQGRPSPWLREPASVGVRSRRRNLTAELSRSVEIKTDRRAVWVFVPRAKV